LKKIINDINMAKVTGLGRGLGSLIPSKTTKEAVREEYKEVVFSEDSAMVQEIPVGKIEPNPYQPRMTFDHDDLDGLILSIKQHGVIQPIIVSLEGDGFQLISGERRWRASKIAGKKTVPAIVRDATTQEKLEISLIENIQRKDLNPIEKALAYRRLIDEFNLTHNEAGRKLGKSRAVVTNTVGFLTLPDKIQKALAEGVLSEGHGRVITGLETPEQQMELFKQIIENKNFTVRDSEAHSRVVKGRATHRAGLSPLLKSAQEDLQSALSTRVVIKGRDDSGEISIRYFSEEELDENVKQITGR